MFENHLKYNSTESISSILHEIQKSSKLPSSFLKKKKKKKKDRMANEKNKEIAEETSGKDNKRSVFIETSVLRLGGTYVLFTTRLNRCQSIHRLHVFPARAVSKAPSADRYRADIRTISRRSSRGNLHHWGKKSGREGLPGEELRSTGGYWTCARWFHPFQDGCFF